MDFNSHDQRWRNRSATGYGSGNFTYTYDAWNRLVKVTDTENTFPTPTTTTVGVYEFSLLHMRTTKTTQAERRDMSYDASWQLLEERVDDGLGAPYDRTVR